MGTRKSETGVSDGQRRTTNVRRRNLTSARTERGRDPSRLRAGVSYRGKRRTKTARFTENVPFLCPFLRQGRQGKQDGAPGKALW